MSKVDILKVNRFRSLFPTSIEVGVKRSEDGGFSAEVQTFDGCFTQADSLADLIDMVNDAVRTYLSIPMEFIQFMPTYLPPIEVAKQFDVFPVKPNRREGVKWHLPRETFAR